MTLKPSIQIAQEAQPSPILDIAEKLGLSQNDLMLQGLYKAKVLPHVWDSVQSNPNGNLILVTALTATPAGEGKTVTSIGLAQAFGKMGVRAALCIREPSLGPLFGMKGGATGGGYAQVLPMEDINLHFTGDFYAIAAAHNLLAALIDNHLFHQLGLPISPDNVLWRRVMDICDRSLRHINTNIGAPQPLTSGFDITAASEIMAIVALAQNIEDLKDRLGQIVVAINDHAKPVFASQFQSVGALAMLLRDAMLPNLVQTLEGTPAFVHCGPFANIAHGCNSLMATRLALKLSDWVITEAGFAADLGAEKFFNIKCRAGNLTPRIAVVVASCKALKMHGGVSLDKITHPNPRALIEGCCNLLVHVENVRKFGIPAVVAINRFPHDDEQELSDLMRFCEQHDIPAQISEVALRGGVGGIALAQTVMDTALNSSSQFKYLYDVSQSIPEKIQAIATEIYRADGVDFTDQALEDIERISDWQMHQLPLCMAKTQFSLSDKKNLLGVPKDWRLQIRTIKISNGAGFLVPITGNMLLMPGLPKVPAANHIDLTTDGKIIGLD